MTFNKICTESHECQENKTMQKKSYIKYLFAASTCEYKRSSVDSAKYRFPTSIKLFALISQPNGGLLHVYLRSVCQRGPLIRNLCKQRHVRLSREDLAVPNMENIVQGHGMFHSLFFVTVLPGLTG